MAYPFHELPTFAAFKQKLRDDYQVEYVDEGCRVQQDGDDAPHSVWFFRRQLGEESRTYVFHNPGDDELISFHVIRSICKHLDIDFKKDGLYGLHLG